MRSCAAFGSNPGSKKRALAPLGRRHLPYLSRVDSDQYSKKMTILSPEDLPEDLPDAPDEQVAHEFEIDVLCLVTTNHKFTVAGIAKDEQRLKKERETEGHSWDHLQEILRSDENFYEDLRVAARNQALVALVTRLQHWASKYARRLDKNREPKSLKKELEFLNGKLKDGPVELGYFLELVDVRDSVIHADSKPQWKHDGRDRTVRKRYVPNGWRVEISENDLAYAVRNTTKQVLWYDQQLCTLGK